MKLKELFKIPDTRYSSAQILLWLWHIWRGNRTQAALNAVTGLMQVAVSLAQVWAVKHAIDVASGVVPGSIYMAVGVMGLLIICDFALNICSIWIRNILGIKAQNRMQRIMLDRILHSRWNGRERYHSGDVLNRLALDVSSVINFITETLPSTLSVVALFTGAFLYLLSMDTVLALITVAIIPVFAIGSKIYVRQMRRLTRLVRDSDSKVQSVMQEAIQHRMLIKTLESENEMTEKLSHTHSQLQHNVIKRTVCSISSNLVLNFGFALSYIIVFLWAAIRMSQHTLTFGGMTAFLQLVNKIQTPARNLTKLIPAFVSVLTAAERLMELEESPLEEQTEPIFMDRPCGIKFKHVSCMYENGQRYVTSDMSFDFTPGTCTAVLGETGAGKTTLLRIMLAVISPESGDAEIYDNKSYQKLSPATRCNFAYVPQGNTLMSGTIRENLQMGKPGASDSELMEALRKSCAGFVDELPEKLDTKCTEQGGGLSEGQAQRIAIARALLRDRPILLLDEATSALDPETEKILLKNILDSHDKTVIFITHRAAVTEYCERTLVVKRTTGNKRHNP